MRMQCFSSLGSQTLPSAWRAGWVIWTFPTFLETKSFEKWKRSKIRKPRCKNSHRLVESWSSWGLERTGAYLAAVVYDCNWTQYIMLQPFPSAHSCCCCAVTFWDRQYLSWHKTRLLLGRRCPGIHILQTLIWFYHLRGVSVLGFGGLW